MTVVLFRFVFVVFYHWAPEQSAGPAPAVDDDPVLERLITRGHYEAIVLA